MKIILAPDKFRGSLEASEVCKAMSEGVLQAFPTAEIRTYPLADGGEGTMRILTQSSHGKYVEVEVNDPLGRTIVSKYGISENGKVAFIEMAEASGLNLLNPAEYNPLQTSTFGTGQLIKHAVESGVREIILGIGGSATNDGGIGMAAALGYQFLSKSGAVLQPHGKALSEIAKIDTSKVLSSLRDCKITVACDVTNPLFGRNGAAYIYGPQKGADSEVIEILDQGLQNLTNIAYNTFGKDVSIVPGAGAAGGLGAGSMWFLNAKLEPGIQIVMKQIGLESALAHADLVISGEGKLDEQTLQGKAIKGLSDACKLKNKPLAVICGTLAITNQQIEEAGFVYATSVLNKPVSLETAQKEAFNDVKLATFNLIRLFFYNR